MQSNPRGATPVVENTTFLGPRSLPLDGLSRGGDVAETDWPVPGAADVPVNAFNHLRVEHRRLVAHFQTLLAERRIVQDDPEKLAALSAKVRAYRLLVANHRFARELYLRIRRQNA
jgi:hypothetical protein